MSVVDNLLTVVILGGMGYLIYLRFVKGTKPNLKLNFLANKSNSVFNKGKGQL